LKHYFYADLKAANDLIDLKCSYSNSEASELDRKKKKTSKRKRENFKQDETEIFNNMFDQVVIS
jgi:hypothetical protein